jgi:hypothetical protein
VGDLNIEIGYPIHKKFSYFLALWRHFFQSYPDCYPRYFIDERVVRSIRLLETGRAVGSRNNLGVRCVDLGIAYAIRAVDVRDYRQLGA